jgi:formylglycine-generating enzyme required for sulfatase activity
MAGKIFVNYRRDDEPAQAARIHDRLAAAFGASNVFMDVDSLRAGQRFDRELDKALAQTDVFVAVMGVRWMELFAARQTSGQPDYVRQEIAGALARGILVIPVLIELASLPRADALPEDMRELVLHQRHHIMHERSGRDLDDLVSAIRVGRGRSAEGEPSRATLPWARWSSVALAAMLALAAAWGATYLPSMHWPWDRSPAPLSDEEKRLARQREAEQAWVEARNSRSFVTVQSFIARFSDTTLADAARARLVTLRLSQSLGLSHDGLSLGERTLGAPRAIPSETNCRDACERNKECLGYTWVKPNGYQAGDPAMCYLKDAISSTSRHPCCISATRGPFPSLSGLDPALLVAPGTGKSFRDRLSDGRPCPACPEIVVAPGGSFAMGSPPTEQGHGAGEEPIHDVTFLDPFAAGRFAVTFDEWDACVADRGCKGEPVSDLGWGRGTRPVIGINWDRARLFAAWLSEKTGKPYRLLTEAEREYVTRAGTTTPYWWGGKISTKEANYNGSYDSSYSYGEAEKRGKTLPVDSLAPNPWGLYHVHGNVFEWVEDCWNENYRGSPTDGSAWISGDCMQRVVRGRSWNDDPIQLRSASRYKVPIDTKDSGLGFRVGRTLVP